MANTALVTAPVASVEIAPGITVHSNMSARERFEAHLKANVAPSQFFTDATVQKFQNEERDSKRAAAKAAPTAKQPASTPSVVVPPQGSPAERAAGVTGGDAATQAGFTPNAPSVPADQVDQTALTKLNEIYRGLPVAERERMRKAFLADLASIYAGRRLGESMDQFNARKAGTSAPATDAPVASQFTPQQWEEGHKSVTDAQGFMPLDRVNKAGLSGYTLPKLIDNQTVHKSVFVQLANARAAGLTQEQVTAYLTAQMKRDGWIK